MYIYDGVSDIDWYYDGKKTLDEMKQDPKYDDVVNKLVVLFDNGFGKVYRYQLADEFALNYGYLLDFQNPKKTLDEIFSRLNHTWSDPIAALSEILCRVELPDELAVQFTTLYPQWGVNISYKKDQVIQHSGELYKVAQDHTSQEQWKPGEVGTESLYTHITLNEKGYPIWQKPTGAHDAYNKDDIVEYNGELYKSLIDGNTYSPDEYPAGWEKYTEPEA